jgi:predicted  nucleic acid-binding Zn-ribbon protein
LEKNATLSADHEALRVAHTELSQQEETLRKELESLRSENARHVVTIRELTQKLETIEREQEHYTTLTQQLKVRHYLTIPQSHNLTITR